MKRLLCLVLVVLSLAGCQSASRTASEHADAVAYKPREYVNAAKPGPQIVVIPGSIKSANAAFVQKVTDNNIADFAEIELAKANFTVLERGDLGSLVNEIQIAAGMGDAETLKKFRRGRFQATRWLVRFDVIKAEPVATAQKKFDGTTLGVIAGALVGSATDSAAAGTATGAALASAKSQDASEVWLVGLRYKILDAVTGEQAATGYFEDKMEIGEKATSFLGFTQTKGTRVGLDTVTQVLVQRAVYEIDEKYKGDAPPPQAVATAPSAPDEAAGAAVAQKPAAGKGKAPGSSAGVESSLPEAAGEEPSHTAKAGHAKGTQATAHPSNAKAVHAPTVEATEGGGVRMDSESYARLQQKLKEDAAKGE
jgi:hypothetical protein